MKNIKKIGLTALAASLVSVSAHAGSLTISGAASMNVGGYSGDEHDGGATFSMGNQFTVTGGGELDNGMTVSISYQLDNAAPAIQGPFDDHSVTVSSDALGSLTLHGHGGGSATSAMDATAAGNVWDSFDGARGQVTAVGHSNSAPGNNSLSYVMPTIMDGVAVNLSYKPQQSGNSIDSGTGYAVTYTGIEGLTLAYSNYEYDADGTTSDDDTTSYKVSYTVSDSMSVTYATNTLDSANTSEVDAEYSALSASYTAGGMTISASMKDGENTDHSTNATADFEYWSLGASFAF